MVVPHLLAGLVGALLVLTGALKLREGVDGLRSSIAAFRIVPAALVLPIAALLPPVEIAVGVAVLVQPVGWVPWLAAAILLAYTAAIVAAIARDLATECGCFGSVLRSQASWTLVARNAVLVALLVPAIVVTLGQSPTASWPLALLGVAIVAGLMRLLHDRRRATAASSAGHVHEHPPAAQALDARP